MSAAFAARPVGRSRTRSPTSASLDEVLIHLLHRVSQRADDLFIREMGGTGLTPRQFAFLFTAARTIGSSQTDLVESTGIDRSTVAEVIPRMVTKGLLQGRRSRQDGRAILNRQSGLGLSCGPRVQIAVSHGDQISLCSSPLHGRVRVDHHAHRAIAQTGGQNAITSDTMNEILASPPNWTATSWRSLPTPKSTRSLRSSTDPILPAVLLQ